MDQLVRILFLCLQNEIVTSSTNIYRHEDKAKKISFVKGRAFTKCLELKRALWLLKAVKGIYKCTPH